MALLAYHDLGGGSYQWPLVHTPRQRCWPSVGLYPGAASAETKRARPRYLECRQVTAPGVEGRPQGPFLLRKLLCFPPALAPNRTSLSLLAPQVVGEEEGGEQPLCPTGQLVEGGSRLRPTNPSTAYATASDLQCSIWKEQRISHRAGQPRYVHTAQETHFPDESRLRPCDVREQLLLNFKQREYMGQQKPFAGHSPQSGWEWDGMYCHIEPAFGKELVISSGSNQGAFFTPSAAWYTLFGAIPSDELLYNLQLSVSEGAGGVPEPTHWVSMMRRLPDSELTRLIQRNAKNPCMLDGHHGHTCGMCLTLCHATQRNMDAALVQAYILSLMHLTTAWAATPPVVRPQATLAPRPPPPPPVHEQGGQGGLPPPPGGQGGRAPSRARDRGRQGGRAPSSARDRGRKGGGAPAPPQPGWHPRAVAGQGQGQGGAIPPPTSTAGRPDTLDGSRSPDHQWPQSGTWGGRGRWGAGGGEGRGPGKMKQPLCLPLPPLPPLPPPFSLLPKFLPSPFSPLLLHPPPFLLLLPLPLSPSPSFPTCFPAVVVSPPPPPPSSPPRLFHSPAGAAAASAASCACH